MANNRMGENFSSYEPKDTHEEQEGGDRITPQKAADLVESFVKDDCVYSLTDSLIIGEYYEKFSEEQKDIFRVALEKKGDLFKEIFIDSLCERMIRLEMFLLPEIYKKGSIRKRIIKENIDRFCDHFIETVREGGHLDLVSWEEVSDFIAGNVEFRQNFINKLVDAIVQRYGGQKGEFKKGKFRTDIYLKGAIQFSPIDLDGSYEQVDNIIIYEKGGTIFGLSGDEFVNLLNGVRTKSVKLDESFELDKSFELDEYLENRKILRNLSAHEMIGVFIERYMPMDGVIVEEDFFELYVVDKVKNTKKIASIIVNKKEILLKYSLFDIFRDKITRDINEENRRRNGYPSPKIELHEILNKILDKYRAIERARVTASAGPKVEAQVLDRFRTEKEYVFKETDTIWEVIGKMYALKEGWEIEMISKIIMKNNNISDSTKIEDGKVLNMLTKKYIKECIKARKLETIPEEKVVSALIEKYKKEDKNLKFNEDYFDLRFGGDIVSVEIEGEKYLFDGKVFDFFKIRYGIDNFVEELNKELKKARLAKKTK